MPDSIYKEDNKLKNLPFKERFHRRQLYIKPLVEDYFGWVKEVYAGKTVLPKGKTADGLKYRINQDFYIGKKNWLIHNTANGAQASALIYSISETAKLSDLHPYYYMLAYKINDVMEYSASVKNNWIKQ